MEILITNDDGYAAKGIHALAEIMCQFGNVTVIAPKTHQSGMGMAVSLGLKQIAHKALPEEGPGEWSYLDATPASCIKFGLNLRFLHRFPDVVISGINHGSNAASAACYSGTLGAAEEAALNGIRAIGVSLSSIRPDADFSAVRQYFPDIFKRLMADWPERYGLFYNVNFPDSAAADILGIRCGYQGRGRWVREFQEWNPELYARVGITPEMLGQSSEARRLESGEKLYMMTGDFLDDSSNDDSADHRIMERGYISIVPEQLDTTDYSELARMRAAGFDSNFR